MGRKWREGEAWLKVVGGRAGGTDEVLEVAQHPILPAFQYHKKRATPSRMMTVNPDRLPPRSDRKPP